MGKSPGEESPIGALPAPRLDGAQRVPGDERLRSAYLRGRVLHCPGHEPRGKKCVNPEPPARHGRGLRLIRANDFEVRRWAEAENGVARPEARVTSTGGRPDAESGLQRGDSRVDVLRRVDEMVELLHAEWSSLQEGYGRSGKPTSL